MQAVKDEVETIHLYVVREEPKKSYTLLPLMVAFLCLIAMIALTLYSSEHLYYEHERLTVPAIFLPLKTFTAQAPIISTGIQNYPAANAEGMLTIENGSVLTETLPAGILFSASTGIEVQTEQAVYIPSGSVAGYSVATVAARAVQAGTGGNIPALAVNAVYGTALYVRNLTAFTGGQDAYSVKVTLPKDRQAAINKVAASVIAQETHIAEVLASPCKQVVSGQSVVIKLTVSCRYATYHLPSCMHVLRVRLAGKNFLVDVTFLPLPQRVWIR
jgi:hypothetical protein